MKRTSAVLSIIWAFAFLTLFVGRPAGAQPVNPQNTAVSDRPSDLEGNWFVEWHDYPEKGQVTRAVAVLYRNWEQVCVEVEGGACSFKNKLNPTDNAWNLSYSVSPFEHNGGGRLQEDAVAPNGHLNIKWGYGTLGHWGGKSELQQAGPNEIRGRWSYGETGGSEVWRRALPDIKSAVFNIASYSWGEDPSSDKFVWTHGGLPASIESAYAGPGKTMRGNSPQFKVMIKGEDLWGHHLIDVGGAVDLEPLPQWRYYIMKNGNRSTKPSDPTQVEGIEQYVVIYPTARPGKYALRVDGFPIPFELVIKNYPGTATKVAEIKFVRKTDQGFEAIPDKTLRGGGLVAVEVTMDADTPPEDKQRSGKIAWGEGPNEEKQLDVYRESARTFRSEVFLIEVAPSAAEALPQRSQ